LWVELALGEVPGRRVSLRADEPGAFPWLQEIATIADGD